MVGVTVSTVTAVKADSAAPREGIYSLNAREPTIALPAVQVSSVSVPKRGNKSHEV